ncbi:unnamed protein product [Linum trigynum]|uniref:Uncharacterized protein n=1 Tax=Linum trigynum TaxID=586398 RepID=A0AAV2CJ36_9ROSI
MSTTPGFSRNREYVVQLDDVGVQFVSKERVSVHLQIRAGLAEELQHWAENWLEKLLSERTRRRRVRVLERVESDWGRDLDGEMEVGSRFTDGKRRRFSAPTRLRRMASSRRRRACKSTTTVIPNPASEHDLVGIENFHTT